MAVVHLVCGFLGVGKTTFAVALARGLGAVRFSVDELYLRLFAEGPTYELDQLSLDRLLAALDDLWPQVAQTGADVVLDFGFWSRTLRDHVRQRAQSLGLAYRLHWLRCPDEVALGRCLKRNGSPGAFLISEQGFWELKARFERPASDEVFEIVETALPPRLNLVDGNLELLTAALAGGGALEALLGVSVADGWAGFPEALPVLCASYTKHPDGHAWGSLFFVDPQARMLVGFGGFKGPPSSDAVVEIGYAIAPAFRGQGLATDAVAQMVQRAFEDAIVRAVDAHTLGHANPSTRVLEKSGFRKIGEINDPDEGVVWHWRQERPAP